MRRRKLVYALTALAALALLVGIARLGRSSEAPARAPVPVAAARVERVSLARTLALAAEFRPFQDVSVHAKVAGYLRSIRVDVGDHVKQGETIATLEIPELGDDLRRATAETQSAREELRRAQARHEELHLMAGRLEQVALKRPNLVAQQDIDSARNQDLGAEAALAAARHTIEQDEAGESRIHTMIGYAVITAPFDGVVTRRFADPGALIQAGTSSSTQSLPVVNLAEDRVLRLVFPVPESAVRFVHDGTPVQIDVQAVGRTFSGKVARLSGQVDRETRTMETEVDVPNPDGGLTPGMYANVTLTLEERAHTLSVPVQAIAGGTALVVAPDGTVEKREVRSGLETPERIEVLAGLREGELVVVGARALLRAGDKVKPRIDDEAARGKQS